MLALGLASQTSDLRSGDLPQFPVRQSGPTGLATNQSCLQRSDSAVPCPVFDTIETQFAWVIKQTLQLLAQTFSLRFAGNFAGTAVVQL